MIGTTEEATVQLCAFFVGDTEYVIDLMRVDEILQPQRATPVPDAPPWIEGVMNLHGSLVPVVNLAGRLNATGAPPPRLRPKWIVARVGQRRVALRVEGVSEVVRTRRSELEPIPMLAGRSPRPFVIGAMGPADRLRLLLDLKAVLRMEEPTT